MEIFEKSLEHIYLVFTATIFSVIFGVILGIIAYRVKYLDKIILWITDTLQTIPSLALLAFLMIFFGLGDLTLIIGLILYSLLPITRNTYTGLKNVSPFLKDAAKGMGMSKMQRLILVEVPLSFPLMFAGIKIALVTSFSIAVLGVLIGAGGLGSIIYAGIQMQDIALILKGAIPVTLMAIMFDILMSVIEKRMIKKAKN
jgi:osmoprotectant transport system permease protein